MGTLYLLQKGKRVREFPLDQERTTIGRAKDNDIQLNDRAVSGHHAVIVTLYNDSFLQDLKSTNGTYVNGVSVRKHALTDNDYIKIGNNELVFEGEVAKAGEPDDFERTMVIKPTANVSASMPSSGQIDEVVQEATGTAPGAIEGHSETQLPRARLQVLSGENFGQELELKKETTTIGQPGIQVAAVLRRPEGYSIVHVPSTNDQGEAPKVNGKPIGNEAMTLYDNDVIHLADVKLGFFLDEQ